MNPTPDSVYAPPDGDPELPRPPEPKRPPKGSAAGKHLAKIEAEIGDQVVEVTDSLTDDQVRPRLKPASLEPVSELTARRANNRMTGLDLAVPGDAVEGQNITTGRQQLDVPTPHATAGADGRSEPEAGSAARAAADCDPVPGVPYEGRVTIEEMVLPVWANRDGAYQVRVTNYGTRSWPAGSRVSYQVWDANGDLVPGDRPVTQVPVAVGANGGWASFDATVGRLDPGVWALTWDIWVPDVGWLTDQGSCASTFQLTVVNQPPALTYKFPASPGTATTRLPVLQVSGSDPDAWPGDGLTYQFTICEDPDLTQGCEVSPWRSSARWQTPTLVWGQTYYWAASVSDGEDVTTGLDAVQEFTVVVPAEDDWRRVGNGLGLADVFGVVLPYGVFLHKETDATLPGSGMPLSVERTFSSGAISTEGAFGRGWLSLFDARVVHDPDADTLRFVYPDGRAETFGQDANGGWISAPGSGSANKVSWVSNAIWVTMGTGEQVQYHPGTGRLSSVVVPGAGRWDAYYTDGLVSRLVQSPGPGQREIAVEWETPDQQCADSSEPNRPYVSALTIDRGPDLDPAEWRYEYQCSTLFRVTDPEGGQTVYTHRGTPTGSSVVFSGRTPGGRALPGLVSGGSWSTVPQSWQQRSVTVTEPGSVNRVIQMRRPLSGYEDYYRDVYNEYNGVTAMYCATREVAAGAEHCYESYDTLEFDVQGRVRVKTTRPDGSGSGTGNARRWLYGDERGPDAGRLTAIIDENFNIVEYAYDGWGNLTSSYTYRDADTQVTSTSYYRPRENCVNCPARLTGARITPTQAGETVPASEFSEQYTYDTSGRLTGVDGPTVPGLQDGEQRSYTYTTGGETVVDHRGQGVGGSMPQGLLRTETTAAGTTTYGYDSAGNLTWVQEPGGGTIGRRYDAAGYLAEEIVNRLTSMTYTRDRLGRVTREVESATSNWVTGEASARVVDRQYDADGLPLTVAERAVYADPDTGAVDVDRDVAEPRVTTYRYTPAGRPQRVTDSGGGVTEYAYSAANPDQVVEVTDPRGRTTAYQYNRAGKVTAVRADIGDPEAPTRAETAWYTYDATGLLLSELDALQRSTYYEYTWDAYPVRAYRPGVVVDGEEQVVDLFERQYDGAGNIVSETVGGQRTTEFVYDAMSRLVSTTLDPGEQGLGRTTTTLRDVAGRVVGTVLSDSGVRTEKRTWDLDAGGFPVAEHMWLDASDPGSRLTTEYVRDVWGNAIRTTDPRGVADPDQAEAYQSIAAVEAGRVVRVGGPQMSVDRPDQTTGPDAYTDFAQIVTRSADIVGYDAFGQITHVHAANGQTTRYEYDTAGRLTAEHQPAYTTPAGDVIEPVTRYEYSTAGDLRRSVDARGATTDYAYDIAGNLVREQAPEVGGIRPTTTYTYDPAGQLISTTSPAGVPTTFGYDALGRMVSETLSARTDPGDGDSPTTDYVTSHTYDTVGNLTSTTTPQGRTTRYEHNAAGDVTAVQPPGRTEPVRYIYDLAGRVTQVTDAAGRGTASTYDGAGRLTATTQLGSDGGRLTTTYEYDTAGNLIASTDPRGTRTTYQVDAANRTTGITQPVTATQNIFLQFGYDAADNLVRVRNGEGAETWTTYNSLGLVEKTIEAPTPRDPDLEDRSWTTTYDAAGNPTTQVKPGGATVTTAYDALGRISTVRGGLAGDNLNQYAEFEYDIASRLTAATYENDEPVTFAWDDLDRMTRSQAVHGSPHQFGYDADGLLTTDTTTNPAIGTTTYERDDAGDVVSTRKAAAGINRSWSSVYDDATGDLHLRGTAGARTVYGYDQYGRTDEIITSNSVDDVLQHVRYTHDPNGNVRTKTSLTEVEYGGQYNYDRANRLTAYLPRDAEGNLGTTPAHTYTWDKAGNRTTAETLGTGPLAEWDYDARNRLVSHTSTSDDGQNTTPFDVDPRGNITTIGDRQLEYDPLDRLTADAPTSDPLDATTYWYDALGRVTFAGEGAAGTWGSELDYSGFSDDPVLAAGLAGPEVVTRAADGEALATTTTGTSGYGTRTAVIDGHGDLLGGITIDGDNLGTRTGTVGYDPFGKVWPGSAAPTDPDQPNSALGYQSDWTNPITGAVDMGARWYDPTHATFLTRDPTSLSPTSPDALNRYAYAAGNPTTYADPTGRWSWWPWGGGRGAPELDLDKVGKWLDGAGNQLRTPAGRTVLKVLGRGLLRFIPVVGLIATGIEIYNWVNRPSTYRPPQGGQRISGNPRTETGTVSVSHAPASTTTPTTRPATTTPAPPPPPPPPVLISHTWRISWDNPSSAVALSNVGGTRVLTTTWYADKYRTEYWEWSDGAWKRTVDYLGRYTTDVIKRTLGKVVDPTRIDVTHTTPTQTTPTSTTGQAQPDGRCGLSGTLVSCELALPTVNTGCARWDAPLRLCTPIAATPGPPGSAGTAAGTNSDGTTPTPAEPQPAGIGNDGGGSTQTRLASDCNDGTDEAGNLSERYKDLATQHVTNSGDTVLGRYPGYLDKAASRGASYFDIGKDWQMVEDCGDDPWALNQHFLDDRIAAGDRILLSVPKSKIGGRWLPQEIQYLLGNGYRWVNQWSLRPGG